MGYFGNKKYKYAASRRITRKKEVFYVTGTGKRMRYVAKDPTLFLYNINSTIL